MRPFLEWLVQLLPPPRVIYDRNGVSKYLSRWYLLGGPRMPDGSSAFDRFGAPRDGAVYPFGQRFGIYLHKFHRGDDEPQLHSHPWRWAISLILAGGYREERRDSANRAYSRYVYPGELNFIRADDFHRVDLLQEDAWSLFIAGPKVQSWGFWDRHTDRAWPWREFISQLRDPMAYARENASHAEAFEFIRGMR